MSIESELAKRAVELVAPGSTKYYRYAVVAALILLLVVSGFAYYLYHQYNETAAKLQQATVLTEQQAQDVNYLQNALKESKQNAEMLAAAVAEAKAGQRQPEVKFIVQAPTVQAAAEQVLDRINQQDKTLPPLALEKTDRTVIMPNETKTPEANWDVGVFKVNNYRNWEWSAGYGWHNKDWYVPVELQRNYSKDHALSAEAHLKTEDKKIKVKGGEIKYTIKTDRLFILF